MQNNSDADSNIIYSELSHNHFTLDESDCPYMEEYIDEILRSPVLENQTRNFVDSDHEGYLSSTSFDDQCFHNDTITTNNSGELSVTDTDAKPKSYPYLTSLPPTNAVHMELQENAKIPNIYQVAVDRSGTGKAVTSFASHAICKQREAIIISAGDIRGEGKSIIGAVNAETFLDPSQRSNTTAAYNSTGTSTQISEQGKSDPYLYSRTKPLPIPGPISPSETRNRSSTISSSLLLHASFPSSPSKNNFPLEKNKTHLDIHLAPALIEASKIRSQFGFGSNHLVPSVPLPPPRIFSTLMRNPLTFGESTTVSKTSAAVTRKTTATATTSAILVEPASFYERKKQRAKDSRVKLNESIDKLSVAINLSGSQSKIRASQYNILCRREETTSSLNSRNTSGLRFMEDATKYAESARKWDRPSFVGLAATMIQNLNSQCEFLFAELLLIRSSLSNQKMEESDSAMDRDIEKKSDIDVCKACGTKLTPLSSTVISIDSSSIDDMVDKDPSIASSKRLKISHPGNIESDNVVTIMNILSCPNAVRSLISFLTPQLLVRCSGISRAWRQMLGSCTGDYWLTQCVKRFGTSNVRRWEVMDGNETVESHQWRNDNYYMNLYKQMHTMNVRPRCTSEGSLRLGEGKLDHIVSAWVSAVVRSNGETLRSVQRSQDGTGYAALHVVELRIFVQNTGFADGYLYIPEQLISVDASTKRRSEEMFEITTDDRLSKVVTQLDGSPFVDYVMNSSRSAPGMHRLRYLCTLRLYESAVIIVHIHAYNCSTTEKFRQKARFMKLLVCLNGATVPLIIPFTASAHIKCSAVSI